jgi:drug/metabolite transporter (DMT)-like permease
VTEKQRRLLPYLALGTVYILWGSTYLAIRIVVREVPPFAAAAARFFCAGVVMAGIASLRSPWGRPKLRQVLDYSGIGILLLGISNAFVMWSEIRIPSGIAALIVASIPLWMTFLDGLRPGGTPWTGRVWLGVLFGLVGVTLVARPESGLAGAWTGVAALEIACFSWAIASLYAQNVPDRMPVLQAAAVEMLAASPVLLVESRLAGEDLSRFVHASPTALLALLYLVVFGSLVGFTAFAYCLNELPATTVGTYAYVNPIVAVLLGSLVLSEPVSPGLLTGAALILVAVLLSTRRAAPKATAPVAVPVEEA